MVITSFRSFQTYLKSHDLNVGPITTCLALAGLLHFLLLELNHTCIANEVFVLTVTLKLSPKERVGGNRAKFLFLYEIEFVEIAQMLQFVIFPGFRVSFLFFCFFVFFFVFLFFCFFVFCFVFCIAFVFVFVFHRRYMKPICAKFNARV